MKLESGKTRQLRLALVCVGVCSALGQAAEPAEPSGPRKTSSADLAVHADRRELPNGLVVLSSADPKVNSVVVDISFAAGAVYEPPKKFGLAHLVEHLVASGTTPDTDYETLMERRGAIDFNAHTSFDRMSFRVVVPPEELPLALWVAADRLEALDALLAPSELGRAPGIITQERALRVDDVPYGAAQSELLHQLFPGGHPLHDGALGTTESVAKLTLDDAKAFAHRYLVASNAVLTITGRFDPATANGWIDQTVGRLPKGAKADEPVPTPAFAVNTDAFVSESLGRRPRVTFAWAVNEPRRDIADALQFGALLLTIYTDGFVGMTVSADYQRFVNGAVFALQVTMPHAVDKLEAHGNAEVVLRNLAQAAMPKDIVDATFRTWDRMLMRELESMDSLASLLTEIETLGLDPAEREHYTERHWRLNAEAIQALSGTVLRGPRLTIQARPKHPLPPKYARKGEQ